MDADTADQADEEGRERERERESERERERFNYFSKENEPTPDESAKRWLAIETSDSFKNF